MPAQLSDIGKDALSGGLAGAPLAAATGGISVAVGADSAFSGLVAYLRERGEDEQADNLQKQAADAYGNLSDASVRAAAAKVLGPTALSQIQLDPKYRAAQDDALADLSRIGMGGGYTLADRSNLQNIQNSNAADVSSAERGILAGLSRRGMAGSSAEVAAALSGAQGAANRNAQSGLQIAANGQDRALKAIMDAGALGGQIDQTDYQRKAAAAQAQDAIDKFNNVAGYDRSVDAYNRQLGILDRQYGFASDQAKNERAQGARDAGYIAGAGRAIDQGVTGYGRSPSTPSTEPSDVAKGAPKASYTRESGPTFGADDTYKPVDDYGHGALPIPVADNSDPDDGWGDLLG